MDVARSLTFVFEDPEWVTKVLIGGMLILLTLLLMPILVGFALAFILNGYMVDVIRNTMSGMEHPMPRWEEWGKWFNTGIKLFVIELVWAIPAILFSLLTLVGEALAGDSGSGLALLGTLFTVGSSLLQFVWSVVLLLILPAVLVRFAETERIAAGFDFGYIADFVQKNLVNIIIAAVVMIVAGILATIVGFILCVVGLLFTLFWVEMVEAHLYGQMGKIYNDLRGDTTPLPPALE
jgi:hypothetical protein